MTREVHLSRTLDACQSETGITAKEYHDLSSAIRDPSFPTLFQSYLEEVSSMESREELISYMNALESSGDIPQGKVLIRAELWLCFDTCSSRTSGIRSIFINVLHSNNLQAACIDPNSGNVNIPFIISEPRFEKSRDGAQCINVDALVGTGTMDEANRRGVGFIVLVSDTLIESLNSNYFKREPLSKDVRLHRQWRYRDNMTKDKVLPFLVDSNHVLGATSARNRPDAPCVTESELLGLRVAHVSDQCCETAAEEVTLISTGRTQPSYELCYLHSKSDDSPDGLRVTVTLPGVTCSADITLEPSKSGISVTSSEHRLDIPLNARGLDMNSGRAIFDKNRSLLTITYALSLFLTWVILYSTTPNGTPFDWTTSLYSLQCNYIRYLLGYKVTTVSSSASILISCTGLALAIFLIRLALSQSRVSL